MIWAWACSLSYRISFVLGFGFSCLLFCLMFAFCVPRFCSFWQTLIELVIISLNVMHRIIGWWFVYCGDVLIAHGILFGCFGLNLELEILEPLTKNLGMKHHAKSLLELCWPLLKSISYFASPNLVDPAIVVFWSLP